MFKKLLVSFGFLFLFLIVCIPSDASKKDPVVFSVLYNNRESTPFQKDWLVLEEYKNDKM